MDNLDIKTAELVRLEQEEARAEDSNWKHWGPYLSERQWGTVREDYSHDGTPWSSFPHDHARGRAYRWGEDGLLGITDRQCRLCFALALWNGRDPILKERLFGVNGHEGVELGVERLDAFEGMVGDLPGGEFAAADHAGQVGQTNGAEVDHRPSLTASV